jgi:hypothetical protein
MEIYIVLLMWLSQILGPVGYDPVRAVRGRYDAAVGIELLLMKTQQ